MPTTEDSVALLGAVPVFETLGPDDLRRVAEVAVPRRFAAQQVIFREGDESDTCYVVRKGHVRAVRENPDGRTIALAHFGPGDIVGELAMFDDERRSATIETLDPVVLGQLVDQARAEGAGERDVLVKVTQADIAQLAGSSRESASRFLAVLERAGVIAQGRGRIVVHDPEALG